MTNDVFPDADDLSAAVRACKVCGHADDEHVEQDIEVAGRTLRRMFCRSCNDWHEPVFDE